MEPNINGTSYLGLDFSPQPTVKYTPKKTPRDLNTASKCTFIYYIKLFYFTFLDLFSFLLYFTSNIKCADDLIYGEINVLPSNNAITFILIYHIVLFRRIHLFRKFRIHLIHGTGWEINYDFWFRIAIILMQ